MKTEKYLPIGSVIQLQGASKRIMIYGRCQKQMDTETIWDYIACLYPEGNLQADQSILFNHDQIGEVFFIGYQDKEEFAFLEKYLEEMKQIGMGKAQ